MTEGFHTSRLTDRNLSNAITLPVDAKCVQQLGSSQLSPEEANVQGHQARVQAFSVGHAGLTTSAHHLCFR